MLDRRQSEVFHSQDRAGRDRRSAPRYVTPGTPALIGWREGDGHRSSPAILINISLGGCAVRVTTFPPEEGAVWLRLIDAESSPWIPVCVVETIKKRSVIRTRRLVRLRFVEPCPYDMFKAAIDGFICERQLPDFDAKGFSIRDWR